MSDLYESVNNYTKYKLVEMLIEKHKDLGGRARVFKKNGFIFDAGPTVITAPYLINELFELFNKDPNSFIKALLADDFSLNLR